MTPVHKGPHNEKPSIGRIFNTSENAQKAILASKNCLASLKPGKVWRHHGPHGEMEIKGSLLLGDIPVAVLHFSPDDGSLLPKGLHGFSKGKEEIIDIVQKKLNEIAPQLSVLDGAEFREPESCWAVPLTNTGRIVGHLKVAADGSQILTEKKVADEIRHIEKSKEK